MPSKNTRSLSTGQNQSANWVADFETTTNPDDCRVWGWGLVSIDDPDGPVEIDNSIGSFMARVMTMNSVVYFHNLGFDGRFLLDWLLKNGYEHVLGKNVKWGEFRTMISKQGKFYSMTVRWMNGKRTEFRDSLKKLPMSVSYIARSFNTPELKGTIDYNLDRPIGWEITPEERKYIENDVRIVAHALRTQLIAGMTGLTVGADSLKEFKRMLGKGFERLFPILNDTMDSEVRRAYRGGWTYADPRYRAQVLERPIRVYDVNSLYPSVMYDRVLPYGEPVWCEGKPKISELYPLFICTITFTAKLKKNHLPCIQVKSNPFFAPSEYQENIDEPLTLTCTNVDLELWREHYDLNILVWEGAWQFKGMAGLFQPYIDKWMEVKKNSKGGLREIAKLHLNSLYGKFATNPDVTPKIPELDETGIVKLVTGEEELRNPVYTPMGVFITAYAREVTIRAAQNNYDSFAYADTDSLHLLTDTDPDTLTVDPGALGAWKFEGEFISGIYVRAKCYTERHPLHVCTCDLRPPMAHLRGCGYDTHIAGLPDGIASRVEFSDYYDGHEFRGKLVPRVVPGGVVLVETTWKLSDVALLTHNAIGSSI